MITVTFRSTPECESQRSRYIRREVKTGAVPSAGDIVYLSGYASESFTVAHVTWYVNDNEETARASVYLR